MSGTLSSCRYQSAMLCTQHFMWFIHQQILGNKVERQKPYNTRSRASLIFLKTFGYPKVAKAIDLGVRRDRMKSGWSQAVYSSRKSPHTHSRQDSDAACGHLLWQSQLSKSMSKFWDGELGCGIRKCWKIERAKQSGLQTTASAFSKWGPSKKRFLRGIFLS